MRVLRKHHGADGAAAEFQLAFGGQAEGVLVAAERLGTVLVPLELVLVDLLIKCI